MKAKPALAILLCVAALAAWVGVARSFRERDAEFSDPNRRPRSVSSTRVSLDVELERLARIESVQAVRRSSHRNPFRFEVRSEVSIQARVQPASVALSITPAGPALKLAGIAENATADGLVRTAIVSAPGELYLVKVGDKVATRYRVERIGVDAVELQDGLTGQPVRIGLR